MGDFFRRKIFFSRLPAAFAAARLIYRGGGVAHHQCAYAALITKQTERAREQARECSDSLRCGSQRSDQFYQSPGRVRGEEYESMVGELIIRAPETISSAAASPDAETIAHCRLAVLMAS